MIIDGEELTFKCNECGHKFKRLIGYGPIYPIPTLRGKSKENTTVCPKCGSNDVHRDIQLKTGFFELRENC